MARKVKITEAHLDRNINAQCRKLAAAARKLRPVVSAIGTVLDAIHDMDRAVSAKTNFLKGGAK